MLEAIVWCLSLSVHDGDSMRCNGERIRILNIEAPERPGSPKCQQGRNGWCDYRRGYKSRDALSALFRTGRVGIERAGKDRYGRTLARVTVNGEDAGEYLLSLGLARPWR